MLLYCINIKQVQCLLKLFFFQALIEQSGKQADDKDTLEQGLEAMRVRVPYCFEKNEALKEISYNFMHT